MIVKSQIQVNNPKASCERTLFNHLIKTQLVVSFNELVSHSDIKWGLTNTGSGTVFLALADVFMAIFYIC